MIKSGSTRKYIFYALGEIALVVIGILIALQINNWNESRKDKNKQVRLMQELHQTAGEDLNRNIFQIGSNIESLESAEIIINHLESRLPYNDTLAHHFSMAHSRLISQIKDNAYQNVKEHGLDFIENDTTRNLITHFFENRVEILEVFDRRCDQFYFQIAAPELILLFEEVMPLGYGSHNLMLPLNYNALADNRKYLSILKSTRDYLKQYIGWQEHSIMKDLYEIRRRLEKEMLIY